MAKTAIGRAIQQAIRSGQCSAIFRGKNSPSNKVATVMPATTPPIVTPRLSTESPVAGPRDSRTQKPAQTPATVPARVAPTRTVGTNRSRCSVSRKAAAAPRSPRAARSLKRHLRAVTKADSDSDISPTARINATITLMEIRIDDIPLGWIWSDSRARDQHNCDIILANCGFRR